MTKYVELFLKIWLLSIFVFALMGNAGSDIWLIGTVVLFALHAAWSRDWQWLKTGWFQLALAFWAWMLICSLLSEWPGYSLRDSGTWIRFPLLVIALSYFLTRLPNARAWFLTALIVGLMIMAGSLVREKLLNPNASRLYGTWGQNTKAGWFILGFGLPFVYFSFERYLSNWKNVFWALPAVGVIVGCAVLTGEIYVTIELLFGIAIFLIATRVNGRALLGLGLFCAFSVAMVLFLYPDLLGRFHHSLATRLPWMPSSDYYAPWTRGILIGELNPFFGIGPKNHLFYCNQHEVIKGISDSVCFPHPHNLYIQTFSETGVPGLLLFLTILIALFVRMLGKERRRHDVPLNVIIALCIMITIMWPISTYSHGFGQHKNFFTWLNLAWAYYLSGAFDRSPKN